MHTKTYCQFSPSLPIAILQQPLHQTSLLFLKQDSREYPGNLISIFSAYLHRLYVASLTKMWSEYVSSSVQKRVQILARWRVILERQYTLTPPSSTLPSMSSSSMTTRSCARSNVNVPSIRNTKSSAATKRVLRAFWKVTSPISKSWNEVWTDKNASVSLSNK